MIQRSYQPLHHDAQLRHSSVCNGTVCMFVFTNQLQKTKKKLNPLTSDNLYHSVGKQHHVSYADRDFLGCPLYYKPPRVPC